jgi:DNA invertase Pin-like site-specific DNA recombinase
MARTVRAVGYSYVDTLNRQPESLALEDQEREIRHFANLRGWELMEICRETSDAAGPTRQPKLECLLGGEGRGEWDVLLIARLDRLTRNIRGCAGFMKQIHQEYGRYLISIEEGIDTRNTDGQLCMRLIDLFSEWDSHCIPDRMRRAIAKKRELGEPFGHAPFGYTYENKKLVGVPRELEVVHMIGKLRSTGMSFNKIAHHLNMLNIPSKRGGAWYPETVKTVFHKSLQLPALR